MLGSWFTSKPQALGDDEKARPSTDATVYTNSPPAPHEFDLSAKGRQHQYSNPHDAVLADLYGLRSEVTQSQPGFPSSPNADMPLHGAELLYDPFSGNTMGVLLPDPIAIPQPADARNEELWASLSRVLELQSEISSMHTQMEGIEAKAKKKARTKERKKGPGRGGVTTPTAEEDIDEVVAGNDVDRERDVEEEFEAVSDSFAGRKDAIDSIMNKLDDLSHALTKFHTLRTPSLDLSGSRGTSTHPTANNPPPIPMGVDLSSPAHRTFEKRTLSSGAMPIAYTRSAPATTHFEANSASPSPPPPLVTRNILHSQEVVNSPCSIGSGVMK